MKTIISFEIGKKLLSNLDRRAEDEGKSRSAILREAVATYIEDSEDNAAACDEVTRQLTQ